ncbi:MAG TPA: hypothetical protein VKE74_29070, partial [Gemmataceae bacterium]|nr:hypothetical protein [Gemmataceae bacterium]
MSAALLAALLATRPEPYRIDLVSITVDDARTLQGKRVRVTFTTGCPSYSINGLAGPIVPGRNGPGIVSSSSPGVGPGSRPFNRRLPQLPGLVERLPAPL